MFLRDALLRCSELDDEAASVFADLCDASGPDEDSAAALAASARAEREHAHLLRALAASGLVLCLSLTACSAGDGVRLPGGLCYTEDAAQAVRGAGEVIEVYPGATLRAMGLAVYKSRPDEAVRLGIAACAACPNMMLKLGGVGQTRFGFDWHKRDKPIGSEELAQTLAPLMHYCIEQFGPNRCFFESNFPVDKISYSYTVIYNAFKRLSKQYLPAERAALFHDTAARVYRISV